MILNASLRYSYFIRERIVPDGNKKLINIQKLKFPFENTYSAYKTEMIFQLHLFVYFE